MDKYRAWVSAELDTDEPLSASARAKNHLSRDIGLQTVVMRTRFLAILASATYGPVPYDH